MMAYVLSRSDVIEFASTGGAFEVVAVSDGSYRVGRTDGRSQVFVSDDTELGELSELLMRMAAAQVEANASPVKPKETQ